MAYNTSKPAPNDNLDTSVNDIQQNFLTSNTVMDVNHYPFDNVTANKGKHKFVQMVNGALPAGLMAGETTLYSKNVGGFPQLFMTRGNLGTEIQMSAGLSPVIGAGSGVTFLPGAIFMQWGSVTKTGAGTLLTFATPFLNNCFTVCVTANVNPVNNNMPISVINVNPSDCILVTGTGFSNGDNFFWMAIGN